MHKRSLAILEMIEKSDKRAQMEARYIIDAKTNPCAWHIYSVPLAEKKLEKYLQISYRLMKYYADVQVKINKPIIERMNNVKPIADITVTKDYIIQMNAKPLADIQQILEDHIVQLTGLS
jgi:hypothetical protein